MNNEAEPKVRKKRYDQNFKRSAVEHWLGSGKSANLTQPEVAQKAGVSVRTVRHWERDHVCPTEDHWQALADILRVDSTLKTIARVLCWLLHSLNEVKRM
jgi:DNA-binding XRE family transcriptional regulator